MAIEQDPGMSNECQLYATPAFKSPNNEFTCRLVAFVPAIDPQGEPNIFQTTANRYSVAVSPLVKYAGDKALTLLLSAQGPDAEVQLSSTLTDFDKLVNAWRDPIEAARVLLNEPGLSS